MISGFHVTVLDIFKHEQRFIKKHLLGLKPTNCMFFNVFSLVSGVPIKARNSVQFNHVCILRSYTWCHLLIRQSTLASKLAGSPLRCLFCAFQLRLHKTNKSKAATYGGFYVQKINSLRL